MDQFKALAIFEYFEERAAILEFEAGFPRWKAEKMARAECENFKQQILGKGENDGAGNTWVD
jgi:hypothetical protein